MPCSGYVALSTMKPLIRYSNFMSKKETAKFGLGNKRGTLPLNPYLMVEDHDLKLLAMHTGKTRSQVIEGTIQAAAMAGMSKAEQTKFLLTIDHKQITR